MPEYYCECCDFSTKIKHHFNRHCNTKKHQNNVKLMEDMANSKKIPKRNVCKFCKKEFKSKWSMTRHQEKSCKNNPSSEKYKKMNDSQICSVENQIKNIMKRLESLQKSHDSIKSSMKDELETTSEEPEPAEELELLNEEDSNQVIEHNNDVNMNHTFNDNFMKGFDVTNTEPDEVVLNGNTYTNKTRIMINGVEVGDNPFDHPVTKNALKVAFGNPFFKKNIQFIPPHYFSNNEFRLFFNRVHSLEIKEPTLDEINNCSFLPIQDSSFIQNITKKTIKDCNSINNISNEMCIDGDGNVIS